jgi:hypothetical protein
MRLDVVLVCVESPARLLQESSDTFFNFKFVNILFNKYVHVTIIKKDSAGLKLHCCEEGTKRAAGLFQAILLRAYIGHGN